MQRVIKRYFRKYSELIYLLIAFLAFAVTCFFFIPVLYENTSLLFGAILIIVVPLFTAGLIQIERMNARKDKRIDNLEEAVESYYLSSQGTLSALWDWDIDNDVVVWRGRAYEVFGALSNDKLPRTSREFENMVHPDDREVMRSVIESYFKKECENVWLEMRVYGFDGKMRWICCGASGLWDADDHAYRLCGSMIDVTLSKRVEKEIFDEERNSIAAFLSRTENQNQGRSSEMLKMITENVSGIICYVDHQEIYQFVNDYGLNFYDMPANDIIGKSLKEVHKDNYRLFQKTIRDALNGETARIDAEIYSPLINSMAHIYGVAKPDFDGHGNVIGFFVFAQDITDLKKTEKKLEEERQNAEHASRAKTEFLANMSHEIRTPMNGIIGLTTMLKKTELNERQQRYVKMIESSGDMLLAIINDILDLAKIESRHMELDIETINLPEKLQNIANIFEEQAVEKSLHFSFTGKENIPRCVNADAKRLEQIINNLLSNAVKYTQEGSIRFKVKAKELNDKTTNFYFEVADTGMGIPEDKQTELFEKFTQVRNRKMDDIQGTGLGLAIFKSLVKMMGGDAGFESREGKGSKFWFEVPLDLATEDDAQDISNGPKTAKKSSPSHEKFKGHVLVVEDVETNRIIVNELLTSLGLTIDEAHNGQEAVEKAKQNDYDLILMDLRMPVMDGIDATEHIMEYQREDFEYTPIVALTAYATEDHMKECLAAGMSDFLTKPLKEDDLVMVLREWLGGLDTFASVELQEQQQKRWAKLKGGKKEKNDGPDIDTSFLDLLHESNPKKAIEIVKSTIKDIDENLTPLENYLAKGDLDSAEKCAHSLKSLSAQAGAIGFSELAMEVEEMCTAGKLTGDYQEKIISMKEKYDVFRNELEKYGA